MILWLIHRAHSSVDPRPLGLTDFGKVIGPVLCLYSHVELCCNVIIVLHAESC